MNRPSRTEIAGKPAGTRPLLPSGNCGSSKKEDTRLTDARRHSRHPRQARQTQSRALPKRTSGRTTNYLLPNAPAGSASLSGWSFCSSLPCSSGGSCTTARPPRQPAAAGGPRPGRTVTLSTATAKKGNIGVYLDAIGTVTPVYTTTIVSQVTGVISQVHYREGQMVHSGEPLIQIDPRPFQANVTHGPGAAGARHQSAGPGAKWT